MNIDACLAQNAAMRAALGYALVDLQYALEYANPGSPRATDLEETIALIHDTLGDEPQ